MSHNIEKAFQGTRQEALAVVEEIQKSLKRYSTMENVNKPKIQMTYAQNVLRLIIKTENDTQCKHRDICCDIMENLLAPHLTPLVDAVLWSLILQRLRYYHYMLFNRKHFLETDRVYKLLKTCKDKLQNHDDYKHILGTYTQHLLLQRSRYETDEGKLQAACTLESITVLFNDMQKVHVEKNVQYPDLIKEMLAGLMLNRSSSIFIYLSSMPTVNKMFESFFALLAALKMPQELPADEMQSFTEQHIDLFNSLIQFDFKDKLRNKLALLYLEVCCKLPIWQKQDKVLAQMFNLIYDYVKCSYSKAMENLPNVYIDVCGKMKNFFEKSNGSLVQNKGFLELLVVLHSFLVNMQRPAEKTTTITETFWQQMSKTEAYTAHLQFLIAYIKVALSIRESKFTSWKCCTSIRKHIVINVVISGMSAYDTFIQNVKQNDAEPQEKCVKDLQKLVSYLVCYGISFLETHTCTDVESNNLKLFAFRFLQVASDLCNAPQSFAAFKALIQDMPKLGKKLGNEQWNFILRRVSRFKIQAHNSLVIREINSLCVVNYMQNLKDPNLVRNQIGVFYTQCLPLEQKHEKCLSVLYAESSYPALERHEKHSLLWYETQYMSKYESENTELKTSLLSCTQTEQDYLYVVCALKLCTKETLEQVQSIRNDLHAKRQRGEQLSRMEQLLWAQSNCILLKNETDTDKKTYMSVDSKDCSESNLKELMLRPQILSIHVNNEMRLISVALDAIEAYEYFYEQADNEFISKDVCFIEWELIVDDLRYMALYLQYAGYNEHATRAWLLHYNMTGMLLDTYNQFRGFAFFCEYSEFFENNINTLCLQEEVERQLPALNNALTVLVDLSRREQTTVLIGVCQLAYYYARQRNFGYSQVLLSLVAQKHKELKQRTGKYDIVLATMEAVKFRIMWKQITANSCNNGNVKSWQNRCLLSEIESILNRFRDFVYISSSDALPYMILLFNLTLQISECTALRLCDNLAYFFTPNTLKVSLQKGSALRVIQVLTSWMWVNLQAEHVQKAQVKLLMIECVLGVKSWQQLANYHKKEEMESLSCAQIIKSVEPPIRNRHGGSMETLRRATKKQDDASTFENMTSKMLEPAGNGNLKRFFKWKLPNDSTYNSAHGEIYRYCCFLLGCLNARMNFINLDFTDLKEFYEKSQLWLDKEKEKNNVILLKSFQNYELLYFQHYANFLRATNNYKNAKKCVERALNRCADMERDVDVVYSVNFALQLHAIEKAINQKTKEIEPTNLRRALQFTTPKHDIGTFAKICVFDENFVDDAICSSTANTMKKAEQQVDPVMLANTKTPLQKQQKFTIYSGEENAEPTKTPMPIKNTPKPKTTIAVTTAKTPKTITTRTTAGTSKTPKPSTSKTPKATTTSNTLGTSKTPKIATVANITKKIFTSGSSTESYTSFSSCSSQLSYEDLSQDLNCCQIIELYTSSEFDENDTQETKENTKAKSNNKLKKAKDIPKNVDKIDENENSVVVIDLVEDSPKLKRNQESKSAIKAKPLRALRSTSTLKEQQQQQKQKPSASNIQKLLKDFETPVSSLSNARAIRTRATRTRQISSDLDKNKK